MQTSGSLSRRRTARRRLEIVCSLVVLAVGCLACSDRKDKGLVTGPADIVDDTVHAEADVTNTASPDADAAVLVDTTPPDVDADAIVDAAPLPTQACPALKSPSLAEISPCKDKNACCSTITQVDPCASDGSSFQSAPSRWQAFRFWTAESPACVEGKHPKFMPIPVEATNTKASTKTLLWSPTCPGATNSWRWAELGFAHDGSALTSVDLAVEDAPISAGYAPCGAKRTNTTEFIALVCRKEPFDKYDWVELKEFWSEEGLSFCCGTPNALVHRKGKDLKIVAALPPGYHRWGLPSVGADAITEPPTAATVILPIMQSELADEFFATDQAYDVMDSGWVSEKRFARVSTEDGSVKLLGPKKHDYPLWNQQVAVVDQQHFAWTYDALAPNFREWTWDGTEWNPAIVIANGTSFVESTGNGVMDGVVCSSSTLVPRADGYYFLCFYRVASLDLDGNLLWALDAGKDFGARFLSLRTAVAGPIGSMFVPFAPDTDFESSPKISPVGIYPVTHIARLEPTGKVAWTWEFKDDTAWAHIDNMIHNGGILHVFGTLVPKTKDSAWAIHIRLDAKIGKELCPGQMPATP